jgi:hypothetical protein
LTLNNGGIKRRGEYSNQASRIRLFGDKKKDIIMKRKNRRSDWLLNLTSKLYIGALDKVM